MDNKQIKIIYEDEQIVVLDKPHGVIVNRADTHSTFTVQDFIEENTSGFVDESADENADFRSRSGIVHRLDKDTSGIMLTAKTPEAFNNLILQFKNRQVQKEYIAVVFGSVKEEHIQIDAPIGRNPRNRLTMAVVADGKPAQTNIERVKQLKIGEESFTSLRIYPKTGRTHQIRVHLAAMKHQIVGDMIYCSRNLLERSIIVGNRMYLHSLGIEFTHPTTNKVVNIQTEFPDEFKEYF